MTLFDDEAPEITKERFDALTKSAPVMDLNDPATRRREAVGAVENIMGSMIGSVRKELEARAKFEAGKAKKPPRAPTAAVIANDILAQVHCSDKTKGFRTVSDQHSPMILRAHRAFADAPGGALEGLQAAFNAALDPEDEALLDALVDSPTFEKLDRIDAQIVIEIILKHAQGVPAP